MVTHPNHFMHKHFVDQGLENSLESIENFHMETIRSLTERLSVLVEKMKRYCTIHNCKQPMLRIHNPNPNATDFPMG
jgi:hypothetical protein